MSRSNNIAILFGLLPLSACVDYPDSVTNEDVLGQLAECQTNVDDMGEQIAALTATVEALQVQVDEHDVRLDDDGVRLDGHDADIASLGTLAGEAESRFIDSDLTLNVPADYSDINEALDALDGRVIASGATVTVLVAAGDYSYDEAIQIDHPNADRIQIVGDVADPSAVTLRLAYDGFLVGNGRSLGLLTGFSLIGEGEGVNWGVVAYDNASVTVANVKTSDFDVAGFGARNGGVVNADVVSDQGSYIGFYADHGIMKATNASSTNSDFGFLAENGGYMYILAAMASDNIQRGIVTRLASFTSATDASVTGTGGTAFETTDLSLLLADHSDAQDTTGSGYVASFGALVYANNSEAYSNVEAGYYQNYRASMVATAATLSDNGTDYIVSGDSDSDDSIETYIWK